VYYVWFYITQEEQLEKHVSLQTSRLNEKEDKLNANFDRIERVLNHVASDLDHVQQEEVRVLLLLLEFIPPCIVFILLS